mmetsp:Transcript_72895/g.170747  ORF Transcript_72895/g.170747 Transcript_72895/m.170747 type:complete len:208 (+) Transcript_72895:475-1098(+)
MLAFCRMANSNSSLVRWPLLDVSNLWNSLMIRRTSCIGTLCFRLSCRHTDQDSDRAKGWESVGLPTRSESSEPESSPAVACSSCCFMYSSCKAAILSAFKLTVPTLLLAAHRASNRSTRGEGIGDGLELRDGLMLGDFGISSSSEASVTPICSSAAGAWSFIFIFGTASPACEPGLASTFTFRFCSFCHRCANFRHVALHSRRFSFR